MQLSKDNRCTRCDQPYAPLARCGCRNDRRGLRRKQRYTIQYVKARAPQELVHNGLSETGRVILYAHGLVGFVDGEIPDSVDLADLCQGPHSGFCRRCAVLIHHVKLCHNPDFTARRLLRVQLLDVLQEAGAGEILRTDQLAADDAALVDNVGFRELEAAIQLVRGLVLVEHGEQAEMLLGYIMLVFGKVFITGDGDDLDARHLILEGLQAGHLFHAGGAPTGPEVQHNHLTFKTLQVDAVLAVLNGEYGCLEADLVGKCAAITAGGERAEY